MVSLLSLPSFNTFVDVTTEAKQMAKRIASFLKWLQCSASIDQILTCALEEFRHNALNEGATPCAELRTALLEEGFSNALKADPEEAFADDLSLKSVVDLKRFWKVPPGTDLATQFWIDGFGRYLREGLEASQVVRMAVAIGVNPKEIHPALLQRIESAGVYEAVALESEEGKSLQRLVELILAFVFPPMPSGAAWLPQTIGRVGEKRDRQDQSTAQKRSRKEDHTASGSQADAISVTSADSSGKSLDEDLADSDELQRLMKENPRLIPRETVKLLRKSLTNETITEFELEHHYTLAELRDEAKRRGVQVASRATKKLIAQALSK